MADQSAMEEAAPLLGGSSPTTKRRSRWQAAAAVAATLGVVALSRGGRTVEPRTTMEDALPPSTVDLIQPVKGAKPLQMGHFGKWTIMASSKKNMDETAEAMWWGYNMMERFRDYSVDPAFPSYSYLGPTGCSTVQRRWLSARHQPPDDEVHVVWNSGNQIQNKATIDGRTLSLSAEEVFESIRTLHVQTALQDNQFSGQRLGWFDVTGIERAVWGARDNWEKFGWPYRLLKGIAVVQDQNYSPHQEVDLYIVRSLTRDGKLLEITAVANNAKDTQEAFMNVKTDPTLRYPAKLPAWTFGVTACGSDVPYIFCGVPRFNRRLFEIQTSEPESGLDSPLLEGLDGLVNITRSAYTHVASTDPITDALFLRKWLKHEPLTDFPDSDTEAWVALPLEQVDGVSEAKKTVHYVHLSKPTGLSAELPRGQGELSLHDFEKFVRFLREQEGGLDWNHYDPFLDEHVGVEGCHMQIPAVASALLAMHNDGVPMLTRRELVTDNPGFYDTVQEERFSVFFDLPASTYAFQLRVNSDTDELKSHGLPEFCDWDFCRDEGFANYREPGALFMDPAVCGFSSLES
mmetsp:Transcript_12889/g.38369  ORF Transcript_12889/g.38369 Transcript_12889/m.38369 type:complete len:574 (-) Transcript_12889:38-1759(-)